MFSNSSNSFLQIQSRILILFRYFLYHHCYPMGTQKVCKMPMKQTKNKKSKSFYIFGWIVHSCNRLIQRHRLWATGEVLRIKSWNEELFNSISLTCAKRFMPVTTPRIMCYRKENRSVWMLYSCCKCCQYSLSWDNWKTAISWMVFHKGFHKDLFCPPCYSTGTWKGQPETGSIIILACRWQPHLSYGI